MLQPSAKLLLTCMIVMGICTEAPAHYLWVLVDGKVVNVYFEESAAPRGGEYMDHFLGSSDVWLRTIESPNPKPVKATEVKKDGKRWMHVKGFDASEYSADCYGKFGVYAYGKTNVLLHYYAKDLSTNSHDSLHELSRSEQMNLDLVPHESGQNLEVTLLWKGNPTAERMIYIRGPKGFRKNIKTDERGRITLTPETKGRYTFRSSVEEPTPGQDAGDSYDLIRHNITLSMRVR